MDSLDILVSSCIRWTALNPKLTHKTECFFFLYSDAKLQQWVPGVKTQQRIAYPVYDFRI